MEPTCTWTQGVFYSYFFPGNSTAEICTLVEPYSPLLYTLLFYFMYSVQPSFHKISISTPKKVNGLISWGGGCKKRVGGNLKTFTEGIIDFSWCTPLVYDIGILLLWDTFINILLCEVKKITVLHTCKLWFTKFEISWIVLVLWTDFKNKNHAIKLLANVVAMF